MLFGHLRLSTCVNCVFQIVLVHLIFVILCNICSYVWILVREMPLLLNFALEYAIRKVQETNLGMDMNGTQQVLAYADHINSIGDDIRTIERNADVIFSL